MANNNRQNETERVSILFVEIMIQISTKTLSVRFKENHTVYVYNTQRMPQSTNHILMIRPARFGYNAETASDNVFQQHVALSPTQVQEKAVEEFDNFVKKLRDAGVIIHVIEDTPEPHTPDSVFPNNWISLHEQDATMCLYPMAAHSRRLERKASVLQYIEKTFHIKTIMDFTRYEHYGKYLEGTGSMVLDRENHIAYASISERTDEELLEKFCTLMGLRPVTFHSADENGIAIYHTNVMMSMADKYAVVCFDCISDSSEREILEQELMDSGKEIIKLFYKQMNSFAGNMLQVKAHGLSKLCVMSTQAYESLDYEQIARIEAYNPILHSDLTTIESNGGGSARCMMAEIFLSVKE